MRKRDPAWLAGLRTASEDRSGKRKKKMKEKRSQDVTAWCNKRYKSANTSTVNFPQNARPQGRRVHGEELEKRQIKNSPSLMSSGDHENERLDWSKILQIISRHTMPLSCTKDDIAAESKRASERFRLSLTPNPNPNPNPSCLFPRIFHVAFRYDVTVKTMAVSIKSEAICTPFWFDVFSS